MVVEGRRKRLTAGSLDSQQHKLAAQSCSVAIQVLERRYGDVERSLLKPDVVAMNER